LHDIWATFGIPVNLKTDNGPPFTSHEFDNMCKFFGIKHIATSPYWARGNGEVERFNRNLKKVMQMQQQRMIIGLKN
jgi:transposase InsO family protein